MSQCWPHFYCDTCSNAYQCKEDQALAWDQENEEVLQTIAERLPDCPCGGHFKPGANPKCPKCGLEFTHQHDPVERLSDPHVIVIDGACRLGGERPYRVKID